MNTISPALAEDTWHEIDTSAPEDAAALIARFEQEQPAVVEFVEAVAAEMESVGEDLSELRFVAVWVWRAFGKAGRGSHTISPATLQAAWDRNMKDAASLADTSDFQSEATSFIDAWHQLPLFGAVMQTLAGPAHESPTDDRAGILALFVKTLIDALDA